MHICIFQTGEPLHIDEGYYRPMRAMLLTNKLLENGHKVTLISSTFFHQRKVFRHKTQKSIKINDNFDIHLIPSIGYKNHIGFKRILDHIILAFNLHFFLRKNKKFYPERVFVGYPPIETSFVMIMWCMSKRIPIILDVKDNWPENFIEAFPKFLKPISYLILFPYFLLAKFIFKKATKITTITKPFVKWVKFMSGEKEETNILKNKFFISPLVRKPILINKKNLESCSTFWSNLNVNIFDKKHFSFIGSLTKSFDFNFIYQSALYLSNYYPDYKFIICGSGDQYEVINKLFCKLNNIVLLNEINQYQAKLLIANSIATLAPYKNTSNFQNSIPNKVIESIENQVPFITTIDGELKKLIKKNNNGVYIPNTKKENLVIYLKLIENKKYLNLLKKNAYQSYIDLFSFDKVFDNILRNII